MSSCCTFAMACMTAFHVCVCVCVSAWWAKHFGATYYLKIVHSVRVWAFGGRCVWALLHIGRCVCASVSMCKHVFETLSNLYVPKYELNFNFRALIRWGAVFHSILLTCHCKWMDFTHVYCVPAHTHTHTHIRAETNEHTRCIGACLCYCFIYFVVYFASK